MNSVTQERHTLEIEDDFSIDQREDWDRLRRRILVLNERAWSGTLQWTTVCQWLNNFNGDSGLDTATERLHALYLLSQMMYFGSREIRVLLHALYMNFFLIPIIQHARQLHNNSRDPDIIRRQTFTCLEKTRFLGVGNPSESGVHLLYYFRQENGLSKNQFLDSANIFSRSTIDGTTKTTLRFGDVERYIFLDDLCGSGETAEIYSEDLLPRILSVNQSIELHYYAIFATSSGLKRVRDKSLFRDRCGSVFELDESYKCLSSQSRYLTVLPHTIDSDCLKKLNSHYGSLVCPGHANGFENGQLLLAFNHNTPDNTLPIIWRDQDNGSPIPWVSAMKRYPKFS